MASPEVALLLSTYERPNNLRRSLASIAAQQDVQNQLELVVTDDGSTDETKGIVTQFAHRVPFSVRFTTHAHQGFHLTRCRNEGVAASTAPYLLFLDGDQLLPPDFVALHLKNRQSGAVIAGDCCYFDKRTSEQITLALVQSGDFVKWTPWREWQRLLFKSIRSRVYSGLHHPTRPRLSGGNVGIWRQDYEAVNGYDEHFVGWGLEDRDLQLRLSRCGLRFFSSLPWTYTWHLWHPRDPTFVRNGSGTKNLQYYRQRGRLTRCRNGLIKRMLGDLTIQVLGSSREQIFVKRLANRNLTQIDSTSPEVEILSSVAGRSFSGQADCNVLVVFQGRISRQKAVDQAHIIVTDQTDPMTTDGTDQAARAEPYRLNELGKALDSIH